ncbi:MAG: YceD family protein [Chloroflexota bacterium]
MKYHLSHLVASSLGERTVVQVQEGARALDEELSINSLEGKVQFTRVNGGIYAQGDLHTQITLTCVRCLEPFSFALDFEIAERFVFTLQKAEADAPYLVAPDGVVDLAEPVRQQIWVSLPIRPLCHAGCKGLCGQCGANLNQEQCDCHEEMVDPRLARLKDLL